MKLLCDVHISFKVINHLKNLGYETQHVNSLPDKWFTSDIRICEYADKNDFVVITKDADFRNSFYIKNTPRKLIKINLGNISNEQLIRILSEVVKKIEKLNKKGNFIVEVDKENVQFNLKE